MIMYASSVILFSVLMVYINEENFYINDENYVNVQDEANWAKNIVVIIIILR